MEVCALASGSSGNCFYIENESKKSGILIDAGISSKS
jgi:phosphoribosyl 1,2-cyclic phosphodiesterase